MEIRDWITVSPDNTVTIRVAQMEMGQGATTTMAQLLAEELGVDWSTLKTEPISIRTHLLRGKVYGRTRTDASRGVRESQELLRKCGAQIRSMFLRAGSERLGVPISELAAANSTITHTPTGRQLTYGELAAAAATLVPPDWSSLELKSPDKWSVIGKPLERLDVPAKVDGSAIYGIDVNLPGMKYAAIAMCPVFGGSLKSYRAPDLFDNSGILKILEVDRHGRPEAIAVVADQWWQAKKACETIVIEWDAGPWGTADSESLFVRMQGALKGPSQRVLQSTGDVEAALSSARQILEAEYFVPYLEHATMEPMNCTALVTDDRFEVWVPTQAPERAIKVAAETAGLPVKKGELHPTQIGGGFGRRLETDFVAQAVQIAKAMKGTPIKLLWSREDTTRHSFYRPANLSRLTGGIDTQGDISAWAHRIVASSEDEVLHHLGSKQFLQAIPNILVDTVVMPCHVPEGLMRSVGLATHGFVTLCFIDELARSAGKDPYQFQRDLLDPRKAREVRPGKISPEARAARLRRVLDEAARKSGWGKPPGPNRGRGISALEYADANFSVVVEVTLDGEGWLTVDRAIVVGDPGFLVNPDIAEAQIEGSIAFGLTSALYGEITIEQGAVVQRNFDDYRILRVNEMPKVETHWLLSREPPWGGLGEIVVALVAPALTNAIYDAGGPRIRSLPIKNHKLVHRQH